MSFSLCFVTDRLSLTPIFQDRGQEHHGMGSGQGSREVMGLIHRFHLRTAPYLQGCLKAIYSTSKILQVFICEMGIEIVLSQRIAGRTGKANVCKRSRQDSTDTRKGIQQCLSCLSVLFPLMVPKNSAEPGQPHLRGPRLVGSLCFPVLPGGHF